MATITCPYCGDKRKSSSMLSTIIAYTEVAGIAGIFPKISFKEKLTDANEWIDLKCPNCQSTYRYNQRTKEVMK